MAPRRATNRLRTPKASPRSRPNTIEEGRVTRQSSRPARFKFPEYCCAAAYFGTEPVNFLPWSQNECTLTTLVVLHLAGPTTTATEPKPAPRSNDWPLRRPIRAWCYTTSGWCATYTAGAGSRQYCPFANIPDRYRHGGNAGFAGNIEMGRGDAMTAVTGSALPGRSRWT